MGSRYKCEDVRNMQGIIEADFGFPVHDGFFEHVKIDSALKRIFEAEGMTWSFVRQRYSGRGVVATYRFEDLSSTGVMNNAVAPDPMEARYRSGCEIVLKARKPDFDSDRAIKSIDDALRTKFPQYR